jgi:hypothetical protein
LLIRMRSQVQVLAGPPPIPAGHSAAVSEPGTPAASLGRAGAAHPFPSARPSTLPGPSTRSSGATTTTHRGRPPSPGQQPRSRCGQLALQPAPVPTAQPPATGVLRHPGLPGRSAVTRGRRRPDTTPAGSATTPRLTDARARQPTATSTRSRGDGCPLHRPGPQRHRLRWDETDASGRTGADSRWLDAGRVDARWVDALWTLDGWTPDGWTPDGWTPDGWTSDGRRWIQTTTLDGWTPHAGRGPPTDATLASLTLSTRRRRPTLDAGWTLRRADAVWASNNPGQLSRSTIRTGLAMATAVSCRCDAAVQLAPWRTAVLLRNSMVREEGNETKADGRAQGSGW